MKRIASLIEAPVMYMYRIWMLAGVKVKGRLDYCYETWYRFVL